MATPEKKILVLTHGRDIHGYALKVLMDDCQVDILPIEKVQGNVTYSWLSQGNLLRKSDLSEHAYDVVWYRRSHVPRPPHDNQEDELRARLVDAECNAFLMGVALSQKSAIQLNPVGSALRAENKINQLLAARSAGMVVPRTLISQECEEVFHFNRQMKGKVIVKKLMGVQGIPLATVALSSLEKIDCATIRECPTMYQECIAGTRHIRLCVWGNQMHWFEIVSDALDWRIEECEILPLQDPPEGLADCVHSFMRILGLRMAMLDFKLDMDGTPFFLEANQQGQFLFLQEETGVALIECFAAYVRSLAREARTAVAMEEGAPA